MDARRIRGGPTPTRGGERGGPGAKTRERAQEDVSPESEDTGGRIMKRVGSSEPDP